jgi:hypothetical protein
MGDNHRRFVIEEERIMKIEDFMCDIEVRLIIPVLRAVARRRLVETENPSACKTVCCKWSKSAIALYCYM